MLSFSINAGLQALLLLSDSRAANLAKPKIGRNSKDFHDVEYVQNEDLLFML